MILLNKVGCYIAFINLFLLYLIPLQGVSTYIMSYDVITVENCKLINNITAKKIVSIDTDYILN